VKIGFLRTSSLGDLVLASACLTSLKNCGVEVYWFTKPSGINLLKNFFPEVVYIDISSKNVWSSLNKLDFFIDLQSNTRSRFYGFVCRFLMGKTTFTIRKDTFKRYVKVVKSFISRRELRSSTEEHQTHQIDRIFASLNWLKKKTGLDFENSYPKYECFSTDSSTRDFKNKKMVCIAPGASFETKKIPKEILLKTISVLKDKVNFECVLIGGESDLSHNKAIYEDLSELVSVRNLTGEGDIAFLTKILQNSDYVLSADSFVAHFAAALGVGVLVLFGPTVESFGFTPLGAKSTWYSIGLSCRPCSRHGKSPCRFEDQLCFNGMDALVVANMMSKGME
jgi:ADP-heptose:LPS heptosyltransferase